jgi:hypothetical protein
MVRLLKRFSTIAGQTRSPSKLYLCHNDHPNDFVYMENLLDFFRGQDIEAETMALGPDGQRPELRRCLHGDAIAVLGMNSLLDHSWIDSQNFLDLAARANVPVIHWIVDHPSTRWPEFTHATAANSRFIFLSPFSEQYFQRYGLPGSHTGYTTNTGVSRHSRAPRLTRDAFMARAYNCMIPLNVRRVGGTLADAIARRDTLDPMLGKAVDRGIEGAYLDLEQPIETEFAAALAETGTALGNDRFNFCVQIIEEVVQIRRREQVLSVARDFPVLIQSDETAIPIAAGGRATLETNVDMTTTFSRMQSARAVLSVNHVNDEIHNRTLNGLNAGCANIIEDNMIHRWLFEQGTNALFFRYDDDSLRRCLELVCTEPARAYEIASAGFEMRDRQPFRFGGFENIVTLARAPALAGCSP